MNSNGRWFAHLLALLFLLSSCGGIPEPREVAVRWAEAVKQGDYDTALSYMNMSDFETAAWLERARQFVEDGSTQTYTIDSVQAAGQSTNVRVRWQGTDEDVCSELQVTSDQKIIVLSHGLFCDE